MVSWGWLQGMAFWGGSLLITIIITITGWMMGGGWVPGAFGARCLVLGAWWLGGFTFAWGFWVLGFFFPFVGYL